jgi:hypothetical protein
MKTNNKTWLTPALRLVKRYQPNTYEAMVNAEWTVYAVFSEKDLLPVSRQISVDDTLSLAEEINHGLAVTCAGPDNEDVPLWAKMLAGGGPPAPLKHTTWVNVPAITRQAQHGGVNPVSLAAYVLVHEWWHRRGYGEEKAYSAGTRFALKMGEPGIARMSEETKAKVCA